MTYSDYAKVYNQLKSKPAKWQKYQKHNKPKERNEGKMSRRCSLCGRIGGHIQKYDLAICRQCFRENAKSLGFKKFK